MDNANIGMNMAEETLGAHLRNLLSPYKNIISVLELAKCYAAAKELRKNLDDIVAFSRSDKMESTTW